MKRCLWRGVFVWMVVGVFCGGMGWPSAAWAQMEGGMEAAEHSQPVPSYLSMKERQAYEQKCPGGPSDKFRLGGKVNNPRNFTLDTLRGQPNQTTVWAFYRSGSSPTGFETGEWKGVLLYDLLLGAEVVLNPGIKNDLYRKIVLVTASDCYQQAFSLGELVPAIGGQHQIIVAYEKDGSLLDTSGFARIISPGDKSGARNVSNIVRIQVIDPPLPPQAANP